MTRPRVGIVGGGVLGTTLAYRLTQAGADVSLFERSSRVGGLAGSMEWGGHVVDRFYHVIVPSDERMIATAEELGLGDQLRFSSTGVGFYADGKLLPFNGVGDLLRFPPLTPVQRARLAWFVAQCQVRGTPERLDEVPLEQWLERICGRGVTDRIWRPLLASRFEGNFSELPATYLWARTRRMSSARKGRTGGEQMGCLVGGHQVLVDALAAAAGARGARFVNGAAVEGLAVGDDGGIDGVIVDGETERFDLTVVTLQPPALKGLLPEPLQPLLEAYPKRYLGVVCLVLKVRRSLTPYYSINIVEPTPITTVVEASHVVGTDHTDGLHLIYVPRYCDPSAPEFSEADESVYQRFTDYMAKMIPGFSRDDVVDWTVQRAPLVEPVHPIGAGRSIAPIWPAVDRLALASNTQIYPWLLNGESVMRMGETVAREAGDRLGLKPADSAESRTPSALSA